MLEILFAFLLSFLESLCALLLYDLHVGLVSLFVFIGENLVFLRVTSSFEVFLLSFVALCYVETIERSLQVVNLILFRSVIALGDFLNAVKHFFL